MKKKKIWQYYGKYPSIIKKINLLVFIYQKNHIFLYILWYFRKSVKVIQILSDHLSLSALWGDALIWSLTSIKLAHMWHFQIQRWPFTLQTMKPLRGVRVGDGGLWGVTRKSAVSRCWWLLHSRCSSSQTSPVAPREAAEGSELLPGGKASQKPNVLHIKNHSACVQYNQIYSYFRANKNKKQLFIKG